MKVIIAILVIALLAIYIQKILLHYKLLRFEADGGLNENEDYYLTFWLTNKYFILKAKSGDLFPIKEYYSDPLAIALKKKINKLLQIMGWTLFVFLVSVLIDTIFY